MLDRIKAALEMAFGLLAAFGALVSVVLTLPGLAQQFLGVSVPVWMFPTLAALLVLVAFVLIKRSQRQRRDQNFEAAAKLAPRLYAKMLARMEEKKSDIRATMFAV